ncbi:MAG: glycosyltransferase [Bacteroidia bacterium]|nr:glycosyltransferase [Bacteroidia bacterium]
MLSAPSAAPVLHALPAAPSRSAAIPPAKTRPALYLSVLAAWAACLWWFHPRLWSLLGMAGTPLEYASLAFFVAFVELAWLYGLYNLGIVAFALYVRRHPALTAHPAVRIDPAAAPAIAVLYTTCNDFVEHSAESCVQQDYPDFRVYLLDDSTDAAYQARVDAFAARFPDRVEVIRRPDRKGFKAGNLNHALQVAAVREPYFAIADADEILPPDFLSRLAPVMEADPQCGFVQAAHRANPAQQSPLAQDLGIGIDLHWQWYQPLRNRYGFVMFLGHGALLRRSCWEQAGGFPDIVSEDLGYAIRIRELGYRGRFAEDVVCFEDFPETVRAFRVRHMKWTRGTCEFLYRETGRLLRARRIPWMEKLDILMPTLNLPLTLFYFAFMVNANLLMPALFGAERPLTLEVAGQTWIWPVTALDAGFNRIFTPDFFAITLMTFFAPVMCFMLGLAHRPARLFRFLSHSTALYAALGPLSAAGVLSFLATRKAVFLVTGDTAAGQERTRSIRRWWQELTGRSHPDHPVIRGFELAAGLLFGWVCIRSFQISFLGLCLAFILLPLMHRLGWQHPVMKRLVWIPFSLVLIGLMLSGLSLAGMQTVFFGYGFHF